MSKKYLIWLDILGFDETIEQIAEVSRRTDSGKIRADFANTIEERTEVAENKGYVTGKCREKDTWILIVESLEAIFRTITCILHHSSSYKGYETIPLEIAVGVEEYAEFAKLQGESLFYQKSTIRFLKTHITDHYRGLYRQMHNGRPLTATFIVFTSALFEELESLDREFCQKAVCKNMKSDGTYETVTFFSADVERVKQRGKMYDFLDKIGRSGSKSYDRIDELYIPPEEYNEIKTLLKNRQIVFITGTAEYGKTYTAVRLLWEYFNEGYEPIWIEGGSERQRREVGKRLEDIETELRQHCVIYFEDPFGKATYECRESLEREIGTVVDQIQSIKDVYVIITSREEVFKEFEKARLSVATIKEFEKKLNIRRPSYDYVKRKEMLLKWAESRECQWLGNRYLKGIILEEIRNETTLPTPLSIKNFAIATTSVPDENVLIVKLREKSTETSRSFTREIGSMSDDKILFLSFPFITSLPTDLVRKEYDKLVGELDVEKPLTFDNVLSWFKDDKIVISSGRIMFSHTSYFEAFEMFLKETLKTDIETSVVAKVLLRLSEVDEAAWDVGRIVKVYFDRLSPRLRNELLLRLSKKEKSSKTVAWLLANNFAGLPEHLRRELMSMLLEKGDTSRAIAWAVRYNFDSVLEDLDTLLIKLSEVDEAAWDVGRIVKVYFDRLSPRLRNELLLRLSKKEKSSKIAARIVANHYPKLPPEIQDILPILSDNEKTARTVAWAININFSKIPADVRNDLLLKLSGRHEAVSNIVWILAEHSAEMPKDLVNLIAANCKKFMRASEF